MNQSSTLTIGTLEYFAYLLGLEGDPLLARFLVLSRVEILADVNERDAWVIITVTSVLPTASGYNDVPLKTRTVARRLRPRSIYCSPSSLVLTPSSVVVASSCFFCFLVGCAWGQRSGLRSVDRSHAHRNVLNLPLFFQILHWISLISLRLPPQTRSCARCR